MRLEPVNTVPLFLFQYLLNCLKDGQTNDFFLGLCHVFISNISFFASNFLNYQRISPIPEFLNSVFQDRSIGTHLKLFFH